MVSSSSSRNTVSMSKVGSDQIRHLRPRGFNMHAQKHVRTHTHCVCKFVQIHAHDVIYIHLHTHGNYIHEHGHYVGTLIPINTYHTLIYTKVIVIIHVELRK